MVVLIPKENGGFRGILLVEVLWKLLLGIVNWQIGVAVKFYDVLHGFREGLGTGTTSLEAKLIQQLMEIREELFYEVLLDIHKDYDYLDR